MAQKHNPGPQRASTARLEPEDQSALRALIAKHTRARAAKMLGTTDEKVESLADGMGVTPAARDRIAAKLREIAPPAETTITVSVLSVEVKTTSAEDAGRAMGAALGIASAFLTRGRS